MSYERKVIALSTALGILLAAWVLGMIFSPERGAARSESAKLLLGKAESAAGIELSSPGGDAIRLMKTGDNWTLADGDVRLPVLASRVKNLLDAIAEPGRLKVVGRSKAAWADFGLDEAKAKRALVKDSGGQVLAELYVGAYASTGSGVYLRAAGSERSYVADSSLSSYVGYGRSSWLDLEILGEAMVADLQSVALRARIALDGEGKAPLAFDYEARRDGQAWKSGGAELDSQSVESMLRSALSIRGEDIVAAPPAGAFSPVSARIELVLSSGVSKVVEVGAAAGDDRFYLRAAGNPLVYLVSAYTLRSILKAPAELAKKK